MTLTSLDDGIYEFSSPYKILNILSVANTSPQDIWGVDGTTPSGVPRKPPSTYLKRQTLRKDAKGNFNNTCKKYF